MKQFFLLVRYKSIMVCMQILHRSLSGQYVNFGMFEIYNDPHLRNAIMVVVKMVQKYRYEVLMSYKKVSAAWWKLLELLFRQHLKVIASDLEVFDYLFKSLYEGVQHSTPSHSSPVLHALDHIFVWIHENQNKNNPPQILAKIQEYLQKNVDHILKIFICLLDLHLFGNESTTWSICKPLYSMVIVLPEAWPSYLQHLLRFQGSTTHQIVKEQFEQIPKSLDRRISEKNRDDFIKNLIAFKNDVKSLLTKPDPAQTYI